MREGSRRRFRQRRADGDGNGDGGGAGSRDGLDGFGPHEDLDGGFFTLGPPHEPSFDEPAYPRERRTRHRAPGARAAVLTRLSGRRQTVLLTIAGVVVVIGVLMVGVTVMATGT